MHGDLLSDKSHSKGQHSLLFSDSLLYVEVHEKQMFGANMKSTFKIQFTWSRLRSLNLDVFSL